MLTLERAQHLLDLRSPTERPQRIRRLARVIDQIYQRGLSSLVKAAAPAFTPKDSCSG
jgi:hypothetical protein